ncbi:MAG TPA: 50S ribosomal protein L31 [Verrucomicrobiae bacterium]|nr:50S ribosomal protein L31 [Verrucomicrobiae bacterium]
MKAGIHPEYKETVARCTCGAEYRVRSTRQDIHLGVCAACHPFFTGQQRFVDTAGRVEKFTRRFGTAKLSEQVKKQKGKDKDKGKGGR